jgi:hypothetical protein
MQNQPIRHVPVRPNLSQLRHQAKEFLRDIRAGDPAAIAEFQASYPRPMEVGEVTLAAAQFALARSYGVASWARLVIACRLIDAIWAQDRGQLRTLLADHPELLTEDARGVPGNWGAPLSYAATAGCTDIVEFLLDYGAADVQYAFDRACLRGNLGIAQRLVERGARPQSGAVMGPCETLNASGLRFLLDLGAEISDADGNPLAPLGQILQTYSRNPTGKHACLELLAERGVDLPDTAPMAVHRGRVDLLERLWQREPDLISRQFSHSEIFPTTCGCDEDPSLALHGTPLDGGTLLHLAVDCDEFEIAEWLVARGAPVDAHAAVDRDGFGGHTPLFGCVVWQPNTNGLVSSERFVRLFLDHGANVNARASLRKALKFVEDESEHRYLHVTPRGWGEQFHDRAWVNKPALRMIIERGGEI